MCLPVTQSTESDSILTRSANLSIWESKSCHFSPAELVKVQIRSNAAAKLKEATYNGFCQAAERQAIGRTSKILWQSSLTNGRI